MIIKSLGAAGQVTGSCHMINASETFLLDCGLFQGTREIESQNRLPLSFDPAELDFVLISHGHLDHCGRLPLLTQGGFRGPIYTSRVTGEIIEIMLRDSAKIQSLETNPLYTEDDVLDVLSLIYPLDSEEETHHGKSSFSFHSSGHLLGSSWIKVRSQGKTLAYSGDLGRYECPYYPPPVNIGKADYLMVEGTLGDRLNPSLDENLHYFYKKLIESIEKKKKILIPAFSLGRSQEILSSLVKLAREDDNQLFFSTPIIMDSPSTRLGFGLFKKYPELHRINPEDLSPPNLHLGDYWSAPKGETEIIISASGMLEGGPSVSHARRILAREDGLLIFTGYQGEETLGRRILEGNKKLIIQDRQIDVKAEILAIPGLSGHGDLEDIKRFLASAQDLERVFLVHGQLPSLEAIKDKLEGPYQVHIQTREESRP